MAKVDLSPQAQPDVVRLTKSNPKLLLRIANLLESIKVTPTEGIGKPEKLKGDKAGLWSRRIDAKHRLVYVIEEDVVRILSAYGHY